MATTTVEEFRGTDNLVIAEITKDDIDGITWGAVEKLAPVAEISKTTETSSESKYYDNKAALVIQGEGADTITLTISALNLETLAKITGKEYDPATGAFLDGEGKTKYFALGYALDLIGDKPGKRYVWRYKGSFNIPDETSQTKNGGTDSNNQSLTYTGISTNYKFKKTGETGKALVVDEADGLANLSTFFDTVTTCDTLQPKQ